MLIIMVVSLSGASYGQNNEWLWADIVNCDYTYNMSPKSACDKNSNVYVADNYGYSADFGDTTILSQNEQMFFAKYDSLGKRIWLQVFYSSNDICDVESIEISGESIYLTGYFSDTLVIGDSTLISYDERDMFIAKYDTSGTFVWALIEGGKGYDAGQSISANNNEGIIVSGAFRDSISIGDTTLIATDYVDAFVSKYDDMGQHEWSLLGFGNGLISVSSSTIDNSDAIYITGRFEESISIDGYTLTSNSYASTFLVKIDQYGQVQWLKKFNGISSSVASDSESNIYLGIKLDDTFLWKIGSAGNVVFGKDSGSINCNALSVDNDDNVIVAGGLAGSLTIGGNLYSTDSVYSSPDNYWIHDVDIIIIKTGSTGDILQVNHVKDIHNAGIGGTQYGWSVSSNNNNIYIARPYHDTATFQGLDTLSGSGFFIGNLTLDSTLVGLNTLAKDNFSIYPNPARGIINISSDLHFDSAQIIDLNGRIIRQSTDKYFRLENLKSGVYFITISTKEGLVSPTQKFIKL